MVLKTRLGKCLPLIFSKKRNIYHINSVADFDWQRYFFVVILEDFYNLLRHRRFGRKSKNEVMI